MVSMVPMVTVMSVMAVVSVMRMMYRVDSTMSVVGWTFQTKLYKFKKSDQIVMNSQKSNKIGPLIESNFIQINYVGRGSDEVIWGHVDVALVYAWGYGGLRI